MRVTFFLRYLLAGSLVGLLLLYGIPAHAGSTGNPTAIPYKPAAADDGPLVYRAIAAFLVSGASVFGLALLVRRYLQSGGKLPGRSRQLERLEFMRLNARSSLIRIRWGQEELLIGENEHSLTLLDKRPTTDIPTNDNQPDNSGNHHGQA